MIHWLSFPQKYHFSHYDLNLWEMLAKISAEHFDFYQQINFSKEILINFCENILFSIHAMNF
jgi:hypothetical protein